jgi:glycosyltransferase involved in cell wall biosynthesis
VLNNTKLLPLYDGFKEYIQVESTLFYERRSGCEIAVTIAIPTFKRLELLKQAIVSAINQNTSQSFLVLIVDNDHQSDGRETIEFLSTLNIQDISYYRNNINIGMFGNWNRCLKLAEGRWITILNDDDLLDAEFISSCLHYINLNPSLSMIGCGVVTLDERINKYTGMRFKIREFIKDKLNKNRANNLIKLKISQYFMFNPHHGSLGILFSIDKAKEMGGFDSQLYPSADYYFFSSMAYSYDAYLMSSALAKYRVLDNESKNAAVAVGWIEQGLKIRHILSLHMKQPAWLLNIYSKLMAIQTARYCKVYWGSDIDVNKSLKNVGLPNLPVYGLVIIVRYILRIWPVASKVKN